MKKPNIQLRAFELDLFGYSHKEIRDKLAREFNFNTLTEKSVRTLIAAEDILAELASINSKDNK